MLVTTKTILSDSCLYLLTRLVSFPRLSPNKPKALNQPNKACGNEKGQISLVVGFSLHFVSTWMLVAAHTDEVTAELSTGASKALNICIGVSLVL